MKNPRRFLIAVAAASLTLAASAAARQQQAPTALNVDSLAARLNLSTEVARQIAPGVEELNALLIRQEEARQAFAQVLNELQGVRDGIAQALTPEQQRDFGALLWQHGASMMGMGGPMGSGHMMGGAHMGAGPMDGGSMMGGNHMSGGAMTGAGHMGSGAMGSGAMGGGSMMGSGHMMGGGHTGAGHPATGGLPSGANGAGGGANAPSP